MGCATPNNASNSQQNLQPQIPISQTAEQDVLPSNDMPANATPEHPDTAITQAVEIYTLPDDFKLLPPSPYLTRTDECPKGAFKTSDGVCSCFYGSVKTEKWGKHQYGVLKPDGSESLGKEFRCTRLIEGDTGPYCENIKGCRTLDGRIYPALEVNREWYYVPGGMDTTLETKTDMFGYGDCVLERTDGIPLYSTLTTPQDAFACDRPICQCGQNTCRNGELCRDGVCRYEKPEAAVLDDTNSQFRFHKIIDDNHTRNYSMSWDKFMRMQETLEGRLYLLRSRHVISNSAEEMNIQMLEYCFKKKHPNCSLESPQLTAYYNMIGIRTFDNITCPGGKLYCHGKGNFPLPKPQNPTAFFCEVVKEVPNYSGTEEIKAWRCGSKNGCECGARSCPWHAVCIDEICLCGKDVVQPDYSCQRFCSRQGCPYEDVLFGLMCEADTCKCGNHRCKRGEICREGACLEAYIDQ